ncbi:MAG: hypothetical protein GWN59_01680, partial [Calditrichae bacterium]|nr:hypothetical protein [Calditrichia bacterium]NIV71577.1 hypothetical protein [Calditrichia bacterium]
DYRIQPESYKSFLKRGQRDKKLKGVINVGKPGTLDEPGHRNDWKRQE